MPRYYFDIHDREYQRDDVGDDFETFEAAREEAMATLPEDCSVKHTRRR